MTKQPTRATQTDAPAGGTIAERIRAAVWKHEQTTGGVAGTSALLLDISGSMGEYIAAGQRKIDRLRELADGFRNGVRRFEFETDCHELGPNDSVGIPTGGTAMHTAFHAVRAAGVRHVVMITDGYPDNEQSALSAAGGLKIDVLYVGPEPAPDFLWKLANRTGGSYGKASLDALKELMQTVRGLLPSGAIQL